MKEIFMVRCRGGEYEDAYDNVIHAWSNKQDAEAHSARLTAEMEREREVATIVREAIKAARAADPEPKLKTHLLLPVKCWPAGMRTQDITAEMRAEREQINAHNDALYEAHSVLNGEWYSRVVEATTAKVLAAHGIPADARFTEWFYGKEEGTEYYVDTVGID